MSQPTPAPAPQLSVVILAAGEGKRMKSRLPKVLQPLAGRSLLAHVLDTAGALSPARIHIVYGHGGEQVRAALRRQTASSCASCALSLTPRASMGSASRTGVTVTPERTARPIASVR